MPLTDWAVSEDSVRTWQFRAVQAIQTPADLLWTTEHRLAVGRRGAGGGRPVRLHEGIELIQELSV